MEQEAAHKSINSYESFGENGSQTFPRVLLERTGGYIYRGPKGKVPFKRGRRESQPARWAFRRERRGGIEHRLIISLEERPDFQ